MRCEAQANARYSLLLRKRQWADAERELDRLQALEPAQNAYPWLLARLELAKNRGDGEAMDRLIAELRARYPRSVSVRATSRSIAWRSATATPPRWPRSRRISRPSRRRSPSCAGSRRCSAART